jgi:hypothetical protein
MGGVSVRSVDISGTQALPRRFKFGFGGSANKK